MHGSKLDLTNISLGKLIYQLRQSIDLYRIIGLNVTALEARGTGKAFFGTVQQMALSSVGVTICKIYEVEKGFELNSIPGIIGQLQLVGFTPEQVKAVEKFGVEHGKPGPVTSSGDFLAGVLGHFTAKHALALADLRMFRNKFAAHSEAGFELKPLASHDTFEEFFAFANSFYGLISNQLINSHPAMMSSTAGPSLIKLLEELGLKEPKFHFPPELRPTT